MRFAVLAVVVTAGALLLALLTREKTVDSGSAEDRVAALLQQSLGTRPRVACPSGVQAEKGKRFTCTATHAGERLLITVQLLDDDGRFRLAGIREAKGR